MTSKIIVQSLPDFEEKSPRLVKVLDQIRFEIEETDEDGIFSEFCWFVREFPRFYRYHINHIEHRLKSINENYLLLANEIKKSYENSQGIISLYNIDVLKVYWDFEALLMAVNSALDLLARIVGTAYSINTPISFNKLCKKQNLEGPVELLRKAQNRWVNKFKDYRDCFTHFTPVDYLVQASTILIANQMHLRCKIPINPNIRNPLEFRYSKRVELFNYSIILYKHVLSLDKAIAASIDRMYKTKQYPKRINNLFFIGQRERSK